MTCDEQLTALLDAIGAPRYSAADEMPPDVALDLEERATRALVDGGPLARVRQAVADARAIHDALGWAHDWHGVDLPPPSRAVLALVKRAGVEIRP